MRIKLICLEDGVVSYGFRRLAAFVESHVGGVSEYFASTNVNRSIASHILTRYGGNVSDEMTECLAQELADADVVGFSSMTGYSDLTKATIGRIREISKHPYLIWGGVHPTIDPEDAVHSGADAICIGEGEFAFLEFLELFGAGKDYTQVKNFWFNRGRRVVRNGLRPLMTPEEMECLPFPSYGGRSKIYKKGKGVVDMGLSDYLASNGLAYNTLWAIGCPYHCSYCSNTRFIENDNGYRKIRHPRAEHVIEEVRHAMRVHPHISSVNFNDDSFLAIGRKDIETFARLWRAKVGVPFSVYGVHPKYVDEDKLEALTWAGLNRVRMGIQSGSRRILDFYGRGTPPERIKKAASVIASFSKYHIPPAYDIIVDNPIETKEDVEETLKLLYDLPRPYSLYVFSLRSIPNTEMADQLKKMGVEIRGIESYYFKISAGIGNLTIYLLTLLRPPRCVFAWLLARAEPFGPGMRCYPTLGFILRILYLSRRAFSFLRFMDFSVITGRSGYVAYKLGLVRLWNRFLTPKLDGAL